ncbi:MAG: zinc ABC transporter substrate-binding protein [Spirochaetia bacterium]|nr:zinc ABC transporter substrate-binding protein [Spirochaetia bacterium]
MKKIFFMVLLAIFLTGCAGKKDNTAVLCGTTMAEALVLDVSDGALRVSSLLPPDACPGHFDMKPSDAQKALSASVFVCQPFQTGLAEKLKEANKGLKVVVIKTPDVNAPRNYFSALNETARLLGGIYPEKSAEFASAASEKIRFISARLTRDVGWMQDIRAKKPAVVCSVLHAGFASYLGFDVCAVFGESEKTTPAMIDAARAKARTAKASFIISNLTGTHDAVADAINSGLKLKKAVLISFPGTQTEGSMYLTLWDYNISRIKETMDGGK